MEIRTQIYINQLAQGIVDLDEGVAWFEQLSITDRRAVLQFVHYAVLESHPGPPDIEAAIVGSAIKPTKTPCVLLRTYAPRVAAGKIVHLPEYELSVSFRLLIVLLGVSDARRKASETGECNHWWHRDLHDPLVVETILKHYHSGTL